MNGKGLVVVIILFLMQISGFSLMAHETGTSMPGLGENWLYVGGGGPGNYSTIQDAIDAANPGDTVFVFDDSSPYHETLLVHTSLSLIGEKKETTIIDALNTSDIVNITADNVTIRGFTLQNSNESGVIINSDNNIITENIFLSTCYGVRTGIVSPLTGLRNNTMSNNLVDSCGMGIALWCGWDTTITGNVFTQCEEAIWLIMSLNTNITLNVITENFIGIWIMIDYHTIVYRNNISFNSRFGLYSSGTNANKILQNNFIGNNQSAVSSQWFIPEIKFWKELGLPIFRRNIWRANYWDEPRLVPYMIPGILLKNRFHFDWFPAQEPYEIPER
jgi:parallel beta-helix repeat protein